MKTEKQKFMDYLKQQHYKNGTILGYDFSNSVLNDGTIYAFSNIVPRHRVSPTGTHTLLYHIACVLFEGVDVKTGDLGCTTFCFYGRHRHKYQKVANTKDVEVLKKCITCDTAAEAIKEFETWRKNSWKILDSWKIVL